MLRILILVLAVFHLEAHQLKAVILDWAGTVQDFGCKAPLVVFVKVFEEQGVAVTIDEAREPMGTYKKDHIRRMTEMPGVRERWHAVHGRDPDEGDVERMYHRFVPLQMECIKSYARMIPGAMETYQFIREQGWLVGTTTGYTQEMQAVIAIEAERVGYRPDFNVTSDRVPSGRPNPHMVWKNLAALEVAPAHAVKVDDTIPGVLEGTNAGCWTVYVAHTGNTVGLDEEELAALSAERREELFRRAEGMGRGVAHYTIGTIAELPEVLLEIDARIRSGEMPYDRPLSEN